jgi:hypothetical protein
MAKKHRVERTRTPLQQRLDRAKQLAAETALVEAARASAPEIKRRLREAGCDLPFYDDLDSYRAELDRVKAWALVEFPSLLGIFDVPVAALDTFDFAPLGVPADWRHVRFTDGVNDGAAVDAYGSQTGDGPRGDTVAFLDPAGRVRTLVRLNAAPKWDAEHPDLKCKPMLVVLLHELGHVQDFERAIHADAARGAWDYVAGEAHANRFGLEECYRRGYYDSADILLGQLKALAAANEFYREIVSRLFAEYTPPTVRRWHEFKVEPPAAI